LTSTRKDPRPLLMPGRLAMLVPGLLLALVVYAMARDIWGKEGALVSLALYSISPTMLAHTGLVTTDLEGRINFLNRGASEITACSPERVVGRSFGVWLGEGGGVPEDD
jgi:PAS domain-containing protein